MSLRHAVLGLLAVQPSTGYELAQRFDRTLANAWHAGHSQIYPELGRLEEAGMVEVIGHGARRSRTWAITAHGRDELRRWMTGTDPNRAQRSETAVRWFLISLLEPGERRAVLERELEYLRGVTQELRAVAERLDGLSGPQPFRPTVELGLRVNAVMDDWLTDQLAALD